MIPTRIINYLKKKKIPFKIAEHKKVFTTYDLAQTLGEKLQNVMKTLLVRADRKYFLVSLPASMHLDIKKLQKALKAKVVEIAKEPAVKKILKLKPGTVGPFGGIHGLEVFLDKAFTKSKEVVVRAGSWTESLRLKIKDLHALENLRVIDVGKKIAHAVGRKKKR